MELTQNKLVLERVRKTAELAQPDEIVWIDGSEEQLEALRRIAVESGELIKLDLHGFDAVLLVFDDALLKKIPQRLSGGEEQVAEHGDEQSCYEK